MFCQNCGKEMNDDNFCTNCGWKNTKKLKSKSNHYIFFIIAAIIIFLLLFFVFKNKLNGLVYDGFSQNILDAKMPIEYSNSNTVNDMDTVAFGYYPQNGDNDPIKWLVLDKDDDKALLLSKDILQCKSFHDVEADVNWEISTLREWCNNEFYNRAFSNEEKERIITTVNVNENSEIGAIGGNDTEDKVFCLSLKEVNKYFGEVDNDEKDETHNWRPMSYSSNYAKITPNLGEYLYYSKAQNEKFYLSSEWWLRDMGFNNRTASIVYCYGFAEGTKDLHVVNYKIRGVRPAIWVELKKVKADSVKKSQWVKKASDWYYYDSDGNLLKGQITPDEYYTDENTGKRMTNFWLPINGKYFYFGKDGKFVRDAWVEYENKYYYILPSGEMATSQWINDEYYVGQDGAMLENTTTPDGNVVGSDGKVINEIKNTEQYETLNFENTKTDDINNFALNLDKDRKKQMEKNIINFLNGKSTTNIDEDSIKEMEYGKTEDKKWDCSEVINDFIKKVVFAARCKNKGKWEKWDGDAYFSKNNLTGLSYNCVDWVWIYEAMTDKDVEMYQNDTILDYIIGELEKNLIHEGDSIHSGWYIDGESREIELPYDIVLTFEQKEIIDKGIAYWKEATIRDELEFDMMVADLIYVDNEGNEQETSTHIKFRRSGWHKDDMYMMMVGLAYDMTFPSISFYSKNEDPDLMSKIHIG